MPHGVPVHYAPTVICIPSGLLLIRRSPVAEEDRTVWCLLVRGVPKEAGRGSDVHPRPPERSCPLPGSLFVASTEGSESMLRQSRKPEGALRYENVSLHERTWRIPSPKSPNRDLYPVDSTGFDPRASTQVPSMCRRIRGPLDGRGSLRVRRVGPAPRPHRRLHGYVVVPRWPAATPAVGSALRR